jgi:hypothetical protein
MTTQQCDAYAATIYDYIKGCTRGRMYAMNRDDYELAFEYHNRRLGYAICLQEFDGEDASVYIARAEAEIQVEKEREEPTS